MLSVCPYNNQTLTVCLSCSSSYLCSYSSCQCHYSHTYCQQFSSYTNFINKLKSILSSISTNKIKVNQILSNLIQNIIEFQQTFNRTSDQTVSLINQIISIKNPQDNSNINIKTSIGQILKNIQKIADKLQTVPNNLQDIESLLFQSNHQFLQSQEKRKQMLIEKFSIDINDKTNLTSMKINDTWAKDIPRLSELENITWMSIEVLDPQTIQLLGQFCPNLKGIRVWKSYCISDEQALCISKYLPYLKELRIDKQKVTDIGGLHIAQNMKKLETLWLDQNYLTAQGKRKIKFLLPLCKNLYV